MNPALVNIWHGDKNAKHIAHNFNKFNQIRANEKIHANCVI